MLHAQKAGGLTTRGGVPEQAVGHPPGSWLAGKTQAHPGPPDLSCARQGWGSLAGDSQHPLARERAGRAA